MKLLKLLRTTVSSVYLIFEAESLAQGFSYSHLIDRKLLVAGLRDILYPNTFEGLNLEGEVPCENHEINLVVCLLVDIHRLL